MDSTQLRTPGYHDDFAGYIGEAWRRRHFAWSLARGRVEDGVGNARLGRVWLILDPLLMVGIYAVVFGIGIRGARSQPNFLLWLLTGQITFRFMQRLAKAGSGSLVKNRALLSSYSFPRIVLLMAETFRGVIGSIPAFALLLVAAQFFQQWPNPRWLAIPLIMASGFALSFGLGGVLARWTYVLPDIDQLTNALFRVLFFASFIFFSAETFLENGGGTAQRFYEVLPFINPFYCLVTLMRWAIVNDGGNQLGSVAVSAAGWSIAGAMIGTWYFYRGELSYSAARIYRKNERKMSRG